MYRCQVCKKRTEDLDVVPCNPANHAFSPIEIRTLHKFIYDKANKTITVLCTGQPPRQGTLGLGGNYGINCIRCRTAIKNAAQAIKDSDIGEKVTLSLQGNGVPGGELAQNENTDTLPAEE